MLKRRGAADPAVDPVAITRAFQTHLYEVNTWLNGKPNVSVLRVHYHNLLKDGKDTAEKIAAFLGLPLNIEAMTQQVDQNLYRNRSKPTAQS
jgi:hypothetical protein